MVRVSSVATFDKTVVVTGFEWVAFSLGYWLGNDLHVGTQAGRVGVWLGKLAVKPNGIVSGELGEPAGNCFIDMSRDGAGGFLAGHNSLLNATGEITVDVAVAFVNDTLKSRALPTHHEIAVVHRTSSVAVRENEWLLRVLSLAGLAVEASSVIVHLVKDTWKIEWKGRGTIAAVWPPGAIRDVGFMVRRISILSVPAALEVELSTNATGAGLFRKEVRLGTDAVEV